MVHRTITGTGGLSRTLRTCHLPGEMLGTSHSLCPDSFLTRKGSQVQTLSRPPTIDAGQAGCEHVRTPGLLHQEPDTSSSGSKRAATAREPAARPAAGATFQRSTSGRSVSPTSPFRPTIDSATPGPVTGWCPVPLPGACRKYSESWTGFVSCKKIADLVDLRRGAHGQTRGRDRH
jgi:hypothetical protein